MISAKSSRQLTLKPQEAVRLSASRLSAIHRPEQQQDELSAIPAPKLAYRHQTSLSSASLTNGGIVTAYTIKDSPPQMQPGNFLASQVLDHTQRLHSAGVAPASGLSTAQLEVLAEDSLGASSPIWNAAARNQTASSILPANELDALLKQPLDVIYTKYIYFLSQGAFEPALRLLSLCIQSKRQDMVNRVTHGRFLDMARQYKASRPVLEYLRILPVNKHDARLYTMAFTALAAARDLEAATAALDLAKLNGVQADKHLLTSFMKVCKSVGNVDRAYRIFQDVKLLPGNRGKPDAYVYCMLIATCAEAMKRDLEVALERKEQYVLLERAFQYVAEAEAAHVPLEVPVWNALLLCAGRCAELNRAFEVLEMMQARGVSANVITYGSLIEACVLCRQPDKARRVFEVALSKGFQSLKLYTQAINACTIPGAVDLEHAMVLYQQLNLKGMKPDRKLFACLMGCAGSAGQLDVAFQLLSDMHSEGVYPSTTVCSGLIHSCLLHGNISVARKVYDLCRQQQVYPGISQFNRLMDWYAKDAKFGEVVSLLTDMTAAGVSPNLNTYRIIINACQRAGQAGLAFQVFALMHGNQVKILQNKFAQTIYYTLIKCCFNQVRQVWSTSGVDARSPQLSAGNLQRREQEAKCVLAALGGGTQRRSNPFDAPPDTIDWASHAVSAFQHMLSRGHTPTLTLLDMLFGTLRLQVPDDASQQQPEGSMNGFGISAGQHHDEDPEASTSGRPPSSAYEVPFDKRAFKVMDEVMARGILPRFDPESPLQLDMGKVPPSVAEVYCMHALLTLERRALKLGHTHYHHAFTFLVPPFDPDLIKWPSYVEKVNRHYTLHLEENDRNELHHRVARQPLHRAASSFNQHVQASALQSMDADARGQSAMDSSDDMDFDDSSSSSSQSGTYAHGYYVDLYEHEQPRGNLEYFADGTTGLAVAATFRRMKVFMDMDWERGHIAVAPTEITRWLRRRRRQVLQLTAPIGAAAVAAAAAAQSMAQGMPPGPSGYSNGTAMRGYYPPVPGAHGLGSGAGVPFTGVGGRALFEQQRSIRANSYGQSNQLVPKSAGQPALFGGEAMPAGPGQQGPGSSSSGSIGSSQGYSQQRQSGSHSDPSPGAQWPGSSARHVHSTPAVHSAPAASHTGHSPPSTPSSSAPMPTPSDSIPLKRPRARQPHEPRSSVAGSDAGHQEASRPARAEVSLGPGMGVPLTMPAVSSANGVSSNGSRPASSQSLHAAGSGSSSKAAK